MSTYARMTRNPKTGKMEPAMWVDNYFGQHEYAITFDGNEHYATHFNGFNPKKDFGEPCSLPAWFLKKMKEPKVVAKQPVNKKPWRPQVGKEFWFLGSEGAPIFDTWTVDYKASAFITGVYPSKKDTQWAAREIRRFVKGLRVKQ